MILPICEKSFQILDKSHSKMFIPIQGEVTVILFPLETLKIHLESSADQQATRGFPFMFDCQCYCQNSQNAVKL